MRGWVIPGEWWPVPEFDSDAGDCYDDKYAVEVPDDLLAEVERTKKAFNEALLKMVKCYEDVHPPETPKDAWRRWDGWG